jgi:SulP family sulfate permease
MIFIVEMLFIVAFTALIFKGELASQVPRALGFITLGDALLCIFVALLSSNPAALGFEQDAPGAMMSVIAAAIVAALPGLVERQFATVILMIVLTGVLTGAVLFALGIFKLGGLARFLPYPVIGGFLAGTGWLLLQGGIVMMADRNMGPGWFTAQALQLWMPGLLLGLLAYFLIQKLNKPYMIPLIMLGASGLFYGYAWIMHLPISALREGGWLFEAHATQVSWQFPITPSFLSDVDWGVLMSQLPAMLPVALISVIGLLLNSSGMELIIKRDIDLNRELVTAGVANLASGAVGGLVGFQDISGSSLNHFLGGKRLTGILTALMVTATLLVGMSSILYLPKLVFGAVLAYLGLELLVEWVYRAWFKFSRADFLTVVIILAILAWRGVLEGVLAGLLLAIFSFVVSYSRVSVIRFALSGQEYRSRVTRPPEEQKLLDIHGGQLFFMRLEGFIFFGTANGIFQQVRDRLTAGGLRYCVFDFSKVTGVDSTGMLSFARMLQWSHEHGITLVAAGLGDGTRRQFVQEQGSVPDETLRFSADADHALEWCEDQIIAQHQAEAPRHKELTEQLQAIFPDEGVEALLPYMQYRDYKQGEYLIRQGDQADFMYFLQSGQMTAQLEMEGKNPVRLETINSGRMVGEVAFFLGITRTASVVVDRDSVVYSISTDELARLEASDPQAARIFHRLSAILLSERVLHLTKTVRALERT